MFPTALFYFFYRDFSVKLSRENEIELFVMRIIFKLFLNLSVSYLYIDRLDDGSIMNK